MSENASKVSDSPPVTLSSDALRALRLVPATRLGVIASEKPHLVINGRWDEVTACNAESLGLEQQVRDFDEGIALAVQMEQAAANAAADREWQSGFDGFEAASGTLKAVFGSAHALLQESAAAVTAAVEEVPVLARLLVTSSAVPPITNDAIRRVLQAFVNAMPRGIELPQRTPFPLPADPLATLLSDLSTEYTRANPPPGAAE